MSNMIVSDKTAFDPRKSTGSNGISRFTFILVLLSVSLGACKKAEQMPTTKERLGSVQELQETQADFYLPRKSVDYITDIRSLKENAPTKIAESSLPSKPAPAETRVATAPATTPVLAPVVAAPVTTPVVTPTPVTAPVIVAAAPKVEETAREVVHVAPSRDASQPCKSPEYPAASRRLEESGTVTLRLLIDIGGNVINSNVVTSSGFPRLDDAAREGLSRCKFRPGTADGRPEQASTSIRFTWKP